MKTSASVVGLKWTLFLGLLLARPAVGQISATTAPEPGSAAQQTEEDPLGRSTPYGTVRGFVRAAQRDDYSRAVQYLDTRKKEEAAEQLARQLQVVLDRGLRSDLDRLSRKPEGDVQDGLRTSRDRIGTIDTSSGKLEILVDRIDRRGQNPIWLFSSETLGLVPAAAEEMGTFGQGLLEKHVPRSLKIMVFGFPLHRWISATIFLALALVLASLVTRALVPLLCPALRRMTGEEDARILASIKAPIRLMLIALAIRLFSMMSTSLLIRHFWSQVAATVAVIGSAWLVIQFNVIASELGTRRLRRRRMLSKIAMLVLVRRLFNAAVAIVAGLLLLYIAGVDLTAVLAGLGVGGLAIAFAAQKTLENLFGGMMIITDEPMRVGDFCRIADQMGTVEDIGLRSTRIRTLSRTVVSIPNGQLAVMNVENFSMRDRFWFRHLIGLRYETSADQLRYVLAEIRSMLYSHPKVEPDGARIRFVGFGGSSLDLEIFAYVKATEMPEFLGIQEDLLLRIMDLIARGGTSIAFPSQTTYLARGTRLDPQKTERAETQVRQWRERSELPFPDFRPDQVGRLRDQIDYPPRESSLRGGGGIAGGEASLPL